MRRNILTRTILARTIPADMGSILRAWVSITSTVLHPRPLSSEHHLGHHQHDLTTSNYLLNSSRNPSNLPTRHDTPCTIEGSLPHISTFPVVCLEIEYRSQQSIVYRFYCLPYDGVTLHTGHIGSHIPLTDNH